jgi:lipopolysaccharide export system ATP-binding protein
MTLSVKNIGKKIYGRKIVHDVSFDVGKGEIVGLLGPNGAGKSTSFYITVGLTGADVGKIFLDDQDITNFPAFQRARLGIVYLPQEASIFPNMTVEENIMVALEISEKDKEKHQPSLTNLLDEFSISHLKDVKGFALSGGERRRVEIARCLATKPSYILLDEPFAGIDPIAVSDIKKLLLQLKNNNIGVLITDHNVKDALSIVDRGYVIYDGRVLANGLTEDLIVNPEVKKFYLGEDFRF